ncbi:MAG: hypothetical protein HY244_02875 [Rhizobiales bacterium]|nr:hypothetical protein [Hyphomicrobiales bacterium]
MEEFATSLLKNNPSTIALLEKFTPAFIVLVAALIASFIAWRQWQTAHYRLLLDMLDRWFAIYVLLLDAICAALSQTSDSEDHFSRLVALRDQQKFIFGPDVSNFITEAIDEIAHLNSSQQAVEQLAEDGYAAEDRTTYRSKIENIRQRLLNRQKMTFDVFKKYMSFDLIKGN